MNLSLKLVAALSLAAPSLGVAQTATLYLTGLKVTNLERSVAFYKALGLKEARRYGDGKASAEVLFNASGKAGEAPTLVLVWDSKHPGPYVQNAESAFSRIGLQTTDAKGLAAKIEAAGGKIVREPRAYQGTGAVIAMATDPDGNPIEVIQPAK